MGDAHGSTNDTGLSQVVSTREDYLKALKRAPLSANTRRAYAGRVAGYLAWLAVADTDGDDPLGDPHARDFAVRDYKSHLKATRHAPASVNATLAALDHFYAHLGLDPARARREALPQAAPRALEPAEQRRFLRAVEQTASPRGRAVGLLGFYAGLRVAELATLGHRRRRRHGPQRLITARRGKVIVRQGRGNAYREVPLHPTARGAVDAWVKERRAWPGADGPALFLNRRGGRLSDRSLAQLVATLGEQAVIEELTTHVLRHTFGTNLVRQGVDVVLVAELMGHRRLDTTRRYTLPSAADRQRAIDTLPVDE